MAGDAPADEVGVGAGGAPRDNAGPATPVTGGRLAPLDGMRAVFLAVVLAHHMVWAVPGYADDWTPGTWAGLDGFFVLSGFLIGGLVFDEVARTGSFRYLTFVARRFLRLYPAMAVALGVMVTVSILVDHVAWGRLLPTARAGGLYAMNWPFGQHQGLAIEYTHLWSLAVEMHFYLALPLLILPLVKLRTPPWAWAATIGVVMAIVWWHRTRVWTGAESFPEAYVSTDTRMDILLWGVLVALALRQGWIRSRHRLVLRALAPVALAWTVTVIWTVDARESSPYRWGMAVSGLAHAILLAWVVLDGRTVVARLLGSAPMAWLGTRSYSMYLYHFPLFFFAGRRLTDLGPQLRIVVTLAILVAISDLSYRLVERPAFALKDRVGATRRAPAVPAEVLADA